MIFTPGIRKIVDGVTVIVCCCNSAARLPQTLSHLAHQKCPDMVRWEVIVVDNASSDGTADVAKTTWASLAPMVELRIITESKPGLANARRAGICAARYDCTIFCDDDNWLAADYVATAIDVMRTFPHVGVLGGQAQPAFESYATVPQWFFTCSGAYAVGVQGLRSGDVSSRGHVWGAGMVLRTSLLRFFYERGFEPLLKGRLGAKLLSGDDSEICKWYLMSGYSLRYDERLRLEHFIPKARLSMEYVEALYAGFDAASEVLSAYDKWLLRLRLRREFLRRPLAWLRVEFSYLRLDRSYRLRMREVVHLLQDFRAAVTSGPTIGRSGEAGMRRVSAATQESQR